MHSPFDLYPMGGHAELSAEYISLPYVELVNRAIKTDWVINEISKTRMEVDFQPLSVDADITVWHTWYGAFSRSRSSTYRILTKSNTEEKTLNVTNGGITGFSVMSPTPLGCRLKIVHQRNLFICNDYFYALGQEAASTVNPNSEFVVNGYNDVNQNGDNLISGGSARFYLLRGWVDNELRMELVPVRRVCDGVNGFWCNVVNKFYS